MISEITNTILQLSDDVILRNSFYYGLSTIPQVLAGTIGLFGVFILFKIQEINNVLCGEGKAIMIEYAEKRDEIEKEKQEKAEKRNEKIEPTFREKTIKALKDIGYSGATEIFNRLNKAIARKDTIDLGLHFKNISKAWKHMNPEGTTGERDYNTYKSLLRFKTNLIKWTVISLSYSAFVILLTTSLILYPYNFKSLIKFHLNNPIFIWMLFFISLLLMIIIISISLSYNKSYPGDYETRENK